MLTESTRVCFFVEFTPFVEDFITRLAALACFSAVLAAALACFSADLAAALASFSAVLAAALASFSADLAVGLASFSAELVADFTDSFSTNTFADESESEALAEFSALNFFAKVV